MSEPPESVRRVERALDAFVASAFERHDPHLVVGMMLRKSVEWHARNLGLPMTAATIGWGLRLAGAGSLRVVALGGERPDDATDEECDRLRTQIEVAEMLLVGMIDAAKGAFRAR